MISNQGQITTPQKNPAVQYTDPCNFFYQRTCKAVLHLFPVQWLPLPSSSPGPDVAAIPLCISLDSRPESKKHVTYRAHAS